MIELASDPASDRLSACGFRLSFTPRTGVLFTCPSRYSSTIGHTGVFSLGGWSPQLPAGFRAPRGTQELHYVESFSFRYRALTVSGAASQPTSPAVSRRVRGSYNPGRHVRRFGLRPFRSPLLRASRLISLPAGTEMFQFPAFASALQRMTGLAPGRVAPFGHPRITGCVRLPSAYRSLPRPSSPLCAQASPTCRLSLDLPKRQAIQRAITMQSCSNCNVAQASRPSRRGSDSPSHDLPSFRCQSAPAPRHWRPAGHDRSRGETCECSGMTLSVNPRPPPPR